MWVSAHERIGCVASPENNGALCSGNGVCVLNGTAISEPNIPNSYCACASGWLSVGDLAQGYHGHDCMVNQAALTALFTLSTIATFVFCTFLIRRLRMVWKYATEKYLYDNGEPKDGAKLPIGVRLRVGWEVPMARAALYALFGYGMVGLACAIRVSDIAKTAFGTNYETSFLYSIGMGFVWLQYAEGVHVSFDLVVKLCKLQVLDIKPMKEFLSKALRVALVLSVVSWSPLTVAPFAPHSSDIYVLLLDFGQGLSLIFFYIGAAYSNFKLIHLLEAVGSKAPKANTADYRQQVLVRLRRRLVILSSSMPTTAVLLFLFAFWPYLRIRISYMFAITPTTGILTVLPGYLYISIPTVASGKVTEVAPANNQNTRKQTIHSQGEGAVHSQGSQGEGAVHSHGEAGLNSSFRVGSLHDSQPASRRNSQVQENIVAQEQQEEHVELAVIAENLDESQRSPNIDDLHRAGDLYVV